MINHFHLEQCLATKQGCRYCKACKLHGKFHAEFRTVSSLQKARFDKHERAKSHRIAVSDPDVRLALVAPPVAAFVEALRLVRQGKAGGAEGTGTLKRDKLLKAKYCLAEALRFQTRRDLRSCNCLTLHSDASKGRLLLRVQGCGPQLRPVHALVGCQKLEDFDSHGIAKCVLLMLADLCSPFKHSESFETSQVLNEDVTSMDKALLAHLFEITEVFNADAAANEQLAGQILESGNNRFLEACPGTCPALLEAMDVNMATFSEVFPNLKVINKDKPQAARRIVSRTWKCDRVLDQIVKKVFMDTDGIVQQIHFSDVLRSMYAQNVRAMQFTPLWNEISDKFSAAKHRFDSWSMPFAKVCLTLDAVVRTAQSAHEERKNEKVGHAARTFLDLLSEEAVLLIGMLADAGEENLQLTRRLDSERTTSGSLAIAVQQFGMKLEVLFLKGAVVKTGYTAHLLDQLQKPRTIYIDKVAKRLGGLPQPQMATIVYRCLKRVSSWVQLAQEVVATEFPAFEILQSMSIFHLESLNDKVHRRDDHRTKARDVSDKIHKVSNVLSLDECALSSQFADYHPVAQHKFESAADMEPVMAWKAALDTILEDKRNLQHHPQEELRQALSRAIGWGCSSSGVEQNFAGVRTLTKSKGNMTEVNLRDEIFLLTTQNWTETQDQELAKAAAVIWSQLFGTVKAASSKDSVLRSVAAQHGWKKRAREGTWQAPCLKTSFLCSTLKI